MGHQCLPSVRVVEHLLAHTTDQIHQESISAIQRGGIGKYVHDQMLNKDGGMLTHLGVSLILVLTFIQVYRSQPTSLAGGGICWLLCHMVQQEGAPWALP